MPFYGLEPFETATARYLWVGLKGPGFFQVRVKGKALEFTSGIQLIRDPHYSGGLAVEVVGWTGPIKAPPTYSPYEVTAIFNGHYEREIVIIGADKTIRIPVEEHAFESDAEYMKLVGSPMA
jgi:hypothetical protein